MDELLLLKLSVSDSSRGEAWGVSSQHLPQVILTQPSRLYLGTLDQLSGSYWLPTGIIRGGNFLKNADV